MQQKGRALGDVSVIFAAMTSVCDLSVLVDSQREP